jgi:hypothetical protein
MSITSTAPFRFQTVVHKEGSVWAVHGGEVQPSAPLEIVLPELCVWAGTKRRVMFALIQDADGPKAFSNRLSGEHESACQPNVYALGEVALHREALHYDHIAGFRLGRLYGVGASVQGPELQIAAIDSGETAAIASIVTNIPMQAEQIPQLHRISTDVTSQLAA